jgi:hypothetical protein
VAQAEVPLQPGDIAGGAGHSPGRR